ncbi:MAG TPA: hypothetical protein VKG38_11390 [Solirubrobacteraceae bacterium]|nr:hypothetical protein [Solirubrobacteraceae bacterium]
MRTLAPWVAFRLELDTVEFSGDDDRMLTTARNAGLEAARSRRREARINSMALV